MATIVLERVKASDLPAAWKKRLKASPNETVTVSIARDTPLNRRPLEKKPNKTFGMWSDRKDIGDAGEYGRALRRPRTPVRP